MGDIHTNGIVLGISEILGLLLVARLIQKLPRVTVIFIFVLLASVSSFAYAVVSGLSDEGTTLYVAYFWIGICLLFIFKLTLGVAFAIIAI